MWLELHTNDGEKVRMINFDNVSVFYALEPGGTLIVTTTPSGDGYWSVRVKESVSQIQSMLGFER